MKNVIPNFITHYNRAEPFRSISNVPQNELHTVLRQLNETNSWGLNRFANTEYIQRRIEVEKRLRMDFISKGGKAVLEYPIYFFLGRNSGFESHERNKPYTIKLADIPAHSVSFTYGDSLLAFDNDYRMQSGIKYQNVLCGRLFTLEDLEGVFSESMDLHFEAQLWVQPG